MYTEEERNKKIRELTIDLVDKAIELSPTIEMKDLSSIISVLTIETNNKEMEDKISELNDRLIHRLTNIVDDALPKDLQVISSLIKTNKKINKEDIMSPSEEMDDIAKEVLREEKGE